MTHERVPRCIERRNAATLGPISSLVALALFVVCCSGGLARTTRGQSGTPSPSYMDLQRDSRAQCTPDQSLLTGEPCAPPCWHGLVPGESTREQVMNALQSDPRVRQESIYGGGFIGSNGKRLGEIAWGSCWTYANMNFVQFENGVVSCIRADLGGAVTLGDVVAEFGAPEGVRAWTESPDPVYLKVLLYYPQMGMTIVSDEVHQLRAEDDLEHRLVMLAPDLPASWTEYYVPGTLEEILERAYYFTDEEIEESVRNTQPWSGFTRIPLVGWND